MAHALETLLDAADRLRDSDIVFLVLGDGARKQALQEIARERRLENVRFIDSVPKADVARYWSLLDVSIIHLRKTDLFTTVIPSKLFECMGMGIPVLHGVAGESAEIVEEQGVGVPFEPENVDQLCDALVSLRNDPDRLKRYQGNCLRASRRFDRSYLAAEMLQVLEDVASAPVRMRAAAIADARPPMRVLILN
ncbi:MAG: glycosyltransferase, partial [Phycisphaerales bacterium]